MSDGLDKDGGISFGKQKKPYGLAESKETEETVESVRNLDANDLAKAERLNAKLSTAKNINLAGFGINTSAIFSLLFYVDSLLVSPDTIVQLNMINEMFGLEIDFEGIITMIQDFKMQIIGLCVSSQTMILGYKVTVQKMKDRGNESFMEVFNEELDKVGI